MKFIFRSGSIMILLILSLMVSACGKKSPEQIAEENKKKTEFAVRRAQTMIFEDKSSEAISMLEQTYQECGQSPEICEALAEAYAQTGNFPNAAMFYETASDLRDGNAELLINAAKAYEHSNVFESAARAYEKYLKIKSNDVVAWKSLANSYEKLEKYKEALNARMSALKNAKRNPNTSEATSIGLLFVKVGNVNQGRIWLEASQKATASDNVETRKEILLGLVAVYLASKETVLLDKTVTELDAIDTKIITEKYPNLRGQLSDFRNKLKEAQDAINAEEKRKAEEKLKAEQEAKSKADAKAKAEADAKVKLDQDTKAKEKSKAKESPAKEFAPTTMVEHVRTDAVVDESPTKAQENAAIYDKLVSEAYAAINNGDTINAEKISHRAIAQDRSRADAWRVLANAYELSGKNSDAYLAAKEAHMKASDDISVALFYLRLASKVLNTEKFLAELQTAHSKFPDNVEIFIGLARIYKSMGDTHNALRFYKMFLDKAPKSHPLYKEMSYEYEELK